MEYKLSDKKVIAAVDKQVNKLLAAENEGYHAENRIDDIIQKSQDIKEVIEPDYDLAPWVQEKLQEAYNNLDSIFDFMKAQHEMTQKAEASKKTALKDHEMQMADSQLMSIQQDAENLRRLLDNLPDDHNLMAWVQSKLTLASNYLNKVWDYMNHNTEQKKTSSDSPEPTDKELYSRVKSEAKDKFEVWPSAYASGWLTKEYKRRFKENSKNKGKSPYKGRKPKASIEKESKGLKTWFDEKWVDISRENEDGSHPSCGRPGGDLNEKNFKKKYPKCVPESKADKMTEKEKESAVRRKREKVREDGKPGKPVYVKTDTD